VTVCDVHMFSSCGFRSLVSLFKCFRTRWREPSWLQIWKMLSLLPETTPFYFSLSQFSPVHIFFFFLVSLGGVRQSTWYVGHCWPIVPAPDDRWW
jgi:hypothetical protein